MKQVREGGREGRRGRGEAKAADGFPCGFCNLRLMINDDCGSEGCHQ